MGENNQDLLLSHTALSEDYAVGVGCRHSFDRLLNLAERFAVVRNRPVTELKHNILRIHTDFPQAICPCLHVVRHRQHRYLSLYQEGPDRSS